MTPEEQAVRDRLVALEIEFERHDHPPIATAEEGDRYWVGIHATHSKNLFLRNQKGDRHYLLMVVHTKRVDLRAVAAQIGDGKLSFASPERLMTYLGVTPGSVSPFGLIHDRDAIVQVYLDREFTSVERVSFHPNVNTVTYALARSDFERFLASCRNPVRYVDVEKPPISSSV